MSRGVRAMGATKHGILAFNGVSAQ